MKTNLIFFLFLLLSLPPAWGQQSISLEDFKKIDNAVEREKIIAQAPADERGDLINADIHLHLLFKYDGEAGLKRVKESYLAEQRGLGDLEEAFNQQWTLVDNYHSQVLSGDVSPAMTKREQSRVGKQLTNEKELLGNREVAVHAFVAKMAASPQALELDSQAKKVLAEMRPTVFDGQPVTKAVLADVGRQMDQIFEKMKPLPVVPPAQAQKEYEEIPEVRLLKR